MTPKPVLFMTLVHSPASKQKVRLMIESLRSFGGAWSGIQFWIFVPDENGVLCTDLESENVRVIPLKMPGVVRNYILGDKVAACAMGEAMMGDDFSSLIWMDPACLVVQPPELFYLGELRDAAFRPVHIRNVGLRASDPIDNYWSRIYQGAGVQDVRFTVESFVDKQEIRAYFNTHAFSVNPRLGLMQRWYELFQELIRDGDFQRRACQDELHQVFLHQAVLSALVAPVAQKQRMVMLPPQYNYPFHMHASIPVERRSQSLNELVCFAYEDRDLHLSSVSDIEIHEPLRSWLKVNLI